jgi:hypothetical protein
MKTDPCREALVKNTEPTVLDLMLTEDQRRPLTVAGHHEWRESLAAPARDFDEVDELVAEIPVVDPYEVHAPSRRSDKEVANLLDLLDNLETDRKETTR